MLSAGGRGYDRYDRGYGGSDRGDYSRGGYDRGGYGRGDYGGGGYYGNSRVQQFDACLY